MSSLFDGLLPTSGRTVAAGTLELEVETMTGCTLSDTLTLGVEYSLCVCACVCVCVCVCVLLLTAWGPLSLPLLPWRHHLMSQSTVMRSVFSMLGGGEPPFHTWGLGGRREPPPVDLIQLGLSLSKVAEALPYPLTRSWVWREPCVLGVAVRSRSRVSALLS